MEDVAFERVVFPALASQPAIIEAWVVPSGYIIVAVAASAARRVGLDNFMGVFLVEGILDFSM